MKILRNKLQSTCVALMGMGIVDILYPLWDGRGNYFGGEPIRKTEVEVRVGKFSNGKAADKDEVTREMIKGEFDRVVDSIWRLYNMAFESDVVPEDWRSAVILLLYNGKGERTECNSYRCISLLSVVGKIYAGILVDRGRKEDLIAGEQGRFQGREGVCKSDLHPKANR